MYLSGLIPAARKKPSPMPVQSNFFDKSSPELTIRSDNFTPARLIQRLQNSKSCIQIRTVHKACAVRLFPSQYCGPQRILSWKIKHRPDYFLTDGRFLILCFEKVPLPHLCVTADRPKKHAVHRQIFPKGAADSGILQHFYLTDTLINYSILPWI